MHMTEEEFDREVHYQTRNFIVKKLLDEGLISEDEYFWIDEGLRRKYQPVTGALLSGKFLLCVPNRANIRSE